MDAPEILADREAKGLATPRQVGLLVKVGHDPEEARRMTREEADRLIMAILDPKRD